MLLQKLFQLKQQWLFYFIWTLLNNSKHLCLFGQSPIFIYLASSQWSRVTWFLFITFFLKTCAHKNIEQFFMPCRCHLTLNAEQHRHWLFFGMAAMPFLCNTKLSSKSSESNKSVLWTIVFMLKRINHSSIHSFIMYVELLVNTSILQTTQNIYPIPPPFIFRVLKMFFITLSKPFHRYTI